MNTTGLKQQAPMRYLLALLVLLMLLGSTLSTAAAREKPVDIALVLDASGSMKKNDPQSLRIEAAKMFVSLLDRDDRIALLSFSNRAYKVTDLLSLDKKKNEDALMQGIDKMAANGKFTNLHDALLQGYEILKNNNKDDSREKHIVLMSDGQMDLGSNERNLKLLEKTLDELTPKLATENIKVHTIAFTKDSYIPLLKLAAEDTGGQFVLLKNANGVHEVFENIFIRTKYPEEIPLKQDSFIVDEDIKELTIVASKYKPTSMISLETPHAIDISKTQHDDKVKWFSAEKFDLITIQNPEPGYWLVKFSEGGNKAYILSDLSLHAESTKKTAVPGAPLHIRVYLSKQGKVVKNKALLNLTSFKIKVTSPSGEVMNNPLIDDGSEIGSEGHDGIYGISYAFDDEGSYKIEIDANSETFDRRKTLFVDVASDKPKQPFSHSADESVATTSTIKAPAETIATTVEEKPVVQQAHEPVPDHNNPHEKAPSDSNLDKHAAADNHASTHESEAVPPTDNKTEHTSDEESLDAANSGYTLKEALIFFILFNVLLAGGGGGYYYYYRRQQKQKAKESAEVTTVKNADVFDENVAETPVNEFAEMDDEHEALDLDRHDSNVSKAVTETSDGSSQIDLEQELSSLLNDEELKKET